MIGSLEQGGSNGLVSEDPSEQVDDTISFPLKSSTTSSPTTSTSNSSPPSQRRSPVILGCDDGNSYPSTSRMPMLPLFMQQPGSLPAGIYHQPQLAITENDRLKKMREKKARNKSRKEKNVLNTFKVEPESPNASYNVDNVLESLGELTQAEKKSSKGSKSKTNGNNNLINGNLHKNHHRSSEKSSVDDDSKKSDSESESETVLTSPSVTSSTGSRDYASTVEFNHIIDSFHRNIVFVDEDLKRQVSRSTENLSFTKVTKKQKRKKKSTEEPVAGTRMVNGGGSGITAHRPPAHTSGSRSRVSNGDGVHEPLLPQREIVAAVNKKPLVQSHSVDDFSSSTKSSSASTASKTDLDLAADFPPLSDVPLSTEECFVTPAAAVAPAYPVWPVLKPSNYNYTSDSSAVIQPTSASESIIHQQQAPPDLTMQANALSANVVVANVLLPDVAVHTQAAPPPSSATETSFNTEASSEPYSNTMHSPESYSIMSPESCPIYSSPEFSNNNMVVATSDGASFIVDNVEIVVSEKKFSNRDETASQMMAPVTIFCKDETFVNEWTSNSDFTFGFAVNEELVSMSFANTDENSVMPSSTEGQQQFPPGMLPPPGLAPLTLNEEDSAIVSFGESLDDLKAVTISPESGISGMGAHTALADASGCQYRSGSSTPRLIDSGASSWTDQAETFAELDGELAHGYDEQGGEDELQAVNPLKFNYLHILRFLRQSWMTIQNQLDHHSSEIRYYRARK